MPKASPLKFFQDYLHHGFYPFFLEKRNFSENLLKTMNMMLEVDILLIKQIELKYLAKIKKLLYLLAIDSPVAPNVSQLAEDIHTSRATVMNYIKYLADARLINMIYPKGETISQKTGPNHDAQQQSDVRHLPCRLEEQDILETFFQNTMWKDHKLNKGEKGTSFLVDENLRFKICPNEERRRNAETIYARHKIEIGHGNEIPIWLFGFLY